MREAPDSPQAKWRAINGEETLKVNYPLTEYSLVFEVGGYKGDWAMEIAAKYNPRIYIWEPVYEFYSLLVDRFKDNPKVSIGNLGLGSDDTYAEISIDKDGSSFYQKTPVTQHSYINDVSRVIASAVGGVDLMNINAEGAEFDIIPRMVETGTIDYVKFLQVQFHPWLPNAEHRRKEILSMLHRTHRIHYNYEFLWEAWERR
jgi:FkbM family methyltransferase